MGLCFCITLKTCVARGALVPHHHCLVLKWIVAKGCLLAWETLHCCMQAIRTLSTEHDNEQRAEKTVVGSEAISASDAHPPQKPLKALDVH